MKKIFGILSASVFSVFIIVTINDNQLSEFKKPIKDKLLSIVPNTELNSISVVPSDDNCPWNGNAIVSGTYCGKTYKNVPEDCPLMTRNNNCSTNSDAMVGDCIHEMFLKRFHLQIKDREMNLVFMGDSRTR